MALTNGDQFTFVDQLDNVRLAGQLVDEGATAGDVLTVNADGSVSALPGGGGGGTVDSVTATDTSIVVDNTDPANPTVATGTLDVIATDHPPAANWSNNSHKITGLANGSASTDAQAYGQGVASLLSAAGDLVYASAANTLARLAKGSDGQVLTLASGLPSWAAASGGGSTDGWTTSSDTWSFASASTFTIAGVDRTAVYTPGTFLRFTQTTVKYATVISSSFSTNTTVTIIVNTDYTIANAAITSPAYSYAANPAGFPSWFNFAPASTGFSAISTEVGRYSTTGRTMNILYRVVGTSNATTLTFSIPVTPARAADVIALLSYVQDSGTTQTSPGRALFSGTTVTLGKTMNFSGGFTASGTKSAVMTAVVEF